MLSDADFRDYLAPLEEGQRTTIRAVRGWIREICPDLEEEIDQGKWFNGLLTYYTADRIHVFALGPISGGFSTFHMMPYYGSPVLQERHGVALKKVLSGKSCVKFKHASQLPEDAIRDILAATSGYAELAREMITKRKRRSA